MIPICIVNDTRVDKHLGCQRVMCAIESLAARHGLQVLATSPAHTDWTRNDVFLTALDKARLVIVNGEGTLHHDRPAGHKLLEVGAYARARSIPAVLLNAGWEANGPNLLRMLNDFALLSMRDSASAVEVKRGGHNTRVVPDLSIYGLMSSQLPPRQRRRIGFTDSVDRVKAVHLDTLRRKLNGDCVSIVYTSPGTPSYLRFLRRGFAVRDVMRPGLFFRIVRMRHKLARTGSDSAERFLDTLAQLGLLVSGRFHACALALVTETPFLGLASNTAKIATLVEDVGLERWRADLTLDVKTILEAAAIGWTAREPDAIACYVANARVEAEQLFCDIRSLA